jgi:hypothetical protein
MRKLLSAGALVACTSFAAVSTASAAKEVGEPCVANGAAANRTALVFTGANNPLIQPVVPEEPPQVITAWKVQVGPGIAPLAQRLEVYRVLTEAQDYRKEAESVTEIVHEGVNVFAARIPVKSWTGYLALYGPGGAFVCNSTPGVAGFFEGSAALGETRNVKSAINQGVPLTATVEDDRDGDSYGDETQDKCPTNPALQTECPPVVAKSKAEPKRKSIVVEVGVSSEALIDVYGQVGWGFKPSPKLKATGAKPTRLIVGLDGPKKTVLPGKRVPFRVPLPKSVLRRLGKLTPKESLTAKLTVSCTDLAGRVKHQRLDVKLQSQGAGS